MAAYLWVNLVSTFLFVALMVIPLTAKESPFPDIRLVRTSKVAFITKFVLYIAYGTWTAYLLFP